MDEGTAQRQLRKVGYEMAAAKHMQTFKADFEPLIQNGYGEGRWDILIAVFFLLSA